MRNLLTISTAIDKDYRSTVSNWLMNGAKILSCGTHFDSEYGGVIWWAIGETEKPTKEITYLNQYGSREYAVVIDEGEN